MGFCLLVATGARALYIRLRSPRCRAALLCLCAALVLLNGTRTVRRNRDWSNEESLYKSGISVNPAKGERDVDREEFEASEANASPAIELLLM